MQTRAYTERVSLKSVNVWFVEHGSASKDTFSMK